MQNRDTFYQAGHNPSWAANRLRQGRERVIGSMGLGIGQHGMERGYPGVTKTRLPFPAIRRAFPADIIYLRLQALLFG